MILKILMYVWLTSLFLFVTIVIVDSKMEKYPKSRFGKWWRKYVVGFQENEV